MASNTHTLNMLAEPDKVKVMNRSGILKLLVLVAAAASAGGCATQEDTGRLLGGAVGAAAGTQVGDGTGRTIATIGGAILGAAIGGAIGNRMDDSDQQRTSQALEDSRSNESTRWVNPDTGYSYDMQPTSVYQSASGPCRDYTMRAVIDGRNETINGTACRQSDGTWR